MSLLKEQIERILHACKEAFSQAGTIDELERVRIMFIGRQGHFANLTDQLKGVPYDEKKVCGPLLSVAKSEAHELYEHSKQRIANDAVRANQEREQYFDVSAYTPGIMRGSLHVYTRLIEQLEDIFISMGYDIASGPELETEYNNFIALNIPEDHPARDMQDTFWTNVPGMLLRTQTSAVQVREMKQRGAPIAIFAPGRVYRNEQIDATHESVFTQGEGLVVDKGISLSHMLATVRMFLQAAFEDTTLNTRVRPGYFPFVEPGLEVDISCPFCSTGTHTKGCAVCKRTGWIELMGSGLVHPHVLRSCNIDPEVYSGFAFGFGIERMAMIKYGINDIRLFHASSIDFLTQF